MSPVMLLMARPMPTPEFSLRETAPVMAITPNEAFASTATWVAFTNASRLTEARVVSLSLL